MGTTVDELIDLKDEAVAACYRVVAAWKNNGLSEIEAAAQTAAEVVERAELYDLAEESDAVSIEDYEENYAPKEATDA